MTRQQWVWTFLDVDDVPLAQPVSPTFSTRFDAEAWLGEQWRRLADQGVAAVRLNRQGEPVGGPLPLRAT